MKLGRIQTVDIRTIWKNEAGDFTPWLAEPENLKLLGEALHLGDLTPQATEYGVGAFSADIVAVDDGGVEVLIENQLEQTDHRHLGQVLTYLAGLNKEEASVVWVSTHFREEHRAAIDWLNRHTSENFDFFGVEIDLIRIDESAAAPRFNIVAMPNDWEKQARQAARQASSDSSTETGLFYQEYWLALRQAAEKMGKAGYFPKAWPRHWLPFNIGRSGFHLSVAIQRAERQLRVELYMHQKNTPPKQAFRQLEASKAQIEADYGSALDWQELPGRRASRIAVFLGDVDSEARDEWPRQHIWILDQLNRFRSVFSERVKTLVLTETLEENGVDATPE